jgi:hypothetical protein
MDDKHTIIEGDKMDKTKRFVLLCYTSKVAQVKIIEEWQRADYNISDLIFEDIEDLEGYIINEGKVVFLS